MRKLTSIALAAAAAALCAGTSYAADELPGRIFYKDGARLEFGRDFDLKLNVQLQPRYTYSDIDGEEDTSSFDMRRARLVASGNLLDQQFSYKLQHDFASNDGQGEMKDAWLQWNSEELANIRFGQFKSPFMKQERVDSSRLFFTERSEVNEFFTLGRQQGAMLHRPFEFGNFYAGIFNGESDDEGINQPGMDNKHNGAASIDFVIGDFGSRTEEGDMRQTREAAGTIGFAVNYGEGESVVDEQGDVVLESDFNKLDLQADAAIRLAGLEIDGEAAWTSFEFDDAPAGTADDGENIGFHVQALYVLDKWGFGGRYGYLVPEEEVYGFDNQSEYSLVLNYFIKGHNLKLQNNITWLDTEEADGESFTDLYYDLQLAGYF